MLNDNSTKKEIEQGFANSKKVIDDLTRAYYGMTWDEYLKILGKKEGGNDDDSNS